MSHERRHYTTLIWLLLLLLTVSSWLLAEHVHFRAAGLSTALLLLALFKVRLIGLHFMELRYAPWPLRLIFEAWMLVVCAAVIGIRWFVPLDA